MYVLGRKLVVILSLLLAVSIIVNIHMFLVRNYSSLAGEDEAANRNVRYSSGLLYLLPPPASAIGPVVSSDGEAEIPRLNTSDVYIIAYYKSDQEINLTKAHNNLPGLVVSHWGESYFDGIYYFIDPKVPDVPGELLDNSTVSIHVRVRSDGWVLSWITKNQSVTYVVMSGLKLKEEVGDKQPWVNKSITTLSYTIYKILVAAGLANETDDNGDGIPDDLVTISQETGYYDYKYCGPAEKEGILAIIGVRLRISGSAPWWRWSSGKDSKVFDVVVGGEYEIKDKALMINYRLYHPARYGSAYLKIYNGTLGGIQELFSDSTSHEKCKSRNIICSPVLEPNQIRVFKLEVGYGVRWGYAESRAELFLVIVGVVK